MSGGTFFYFILILYCKHNGMSCTKTVHTNSYCGNFSKYSNILVFFLLPDSSHICLHVTPYTVIGYTSHRALVWCCLEFCFRMLNCPPFKAIRFRNFGLYFFFKQKYEKFLGEVGDSEVGAKSIKYFVFKRNHFCR